MTYHEGIRISYNEASKAVVIAFRGDKIEPKVTFASRAAAYEHAENICRANGWLPERPCLR